MDDDMGDVFRAMKERNKERKADNLATANQTAALDWLKHTPYHWSLMLDGAKLDYWPSTNKWMWRGKKFTGTIRDVEAFVANRGGSAEAVSEQLPEVQSSEAVSDTPPLPIFRDVVTVDNNDEDIPF